MKSLHLLLLIAILLTAQHGRSHGFLHGSKLLGIGVGNQQTKAIRITAETKASRQAAVMPFVFLQRLGARNVGDDDDGGEQLSAYQGDSAASDIPSDIGKKSKKPKKQRKRAPKVTEQDISNSADGDNLLEQDGVVESFVLSKETLKEIRFERQRLEAFLNQVIKAIENAKAIGNLASMATPLSDYERAIPYGRPLFAVMHKKGKFDDNAEFSVLSRMLLSKQEGWSDNDRVCVSVLGTRLQIGQTSVNLASDLVAKGYALLSNYVPKSGGSDGSACIFFPPDPVCARLAMRLMDEDTVISYENNKFGGLDKTFWMSKLTKIFSTGLCIPNQGDLGEVAAASYLLFCGDLIRKTIDKNYTTFSVPLSTYVQCLLSPHEFIQPRQPDESDQQMIVPEGSMYRDAHVSFIQVTRNYIRFDAWYFHNQGFLRELYESGNAMYTYPGFDTFDFVASIKLTSFTNEETYAPLFVGFSTTTDKASKIALLPNITALLANTSNPEKGLGIQLLFDRSKKGFQPSPNILTVEDVGSVLNGEAIAKVVFVPQDDPFGVTSMLTETILCGSAKSEIYASHSNLYNHPLSEVDSSDLLRSNSLKETSTYLDSLRKALLTSREKKLKG